MDLRLLSPAEKLAVLFGRISIYDESPVARAARQAWAEWRAGLPEAYTTDQSDALAFELAARYDAAHPKE